MIYPHLIMNHRRHTNIFLLLASLFLYLPLQGQQQKRIVAYRNGQYWGFASPETGKIIIAPTLDSIGSFQDDYSGEEYPVTWVKKNGRYGLVNRLGEWVLPLNERAPFPVGQVSKGFYCIERYAFGARSPEEESQLISSQQDFVARPIAFFNAMGRTVGKPFEFENMVYLNDPGCGGWEDPNGFDDRPDEYLYDQPIRIICKRQKMGLFDLKQGRVMLEPVWSYLNVHETVIIAQSWPKGREGVQNYDTYVLINPKTGKQTIIPSQISIDYVQRPGKLLLARDKKSGLYGFVSTTGSVIIPFRFKSANLFSRNGLTKVEWKDGTWHIINTSGQEIKLNPNEFMAPSGEIWVRSKKDSLLRKTRSLPADEAGRIGLSGYPSEINPWGKSFLRLQRGLKTGLANKEGKILVPPELDTMDFEDFGYVQTLDSTLYGRYFLVSKNGRKWLFDARTFQPVLPEIAPGSGLSLGNTFDHSNFDMMSPLSGDSLFVVRLANGACDVLNARSGRRWGIEKAKNIILSGDTYTNKRWIQTQPFHPDSHPQCFSLAGQHALRNHIPRSFDDGPVAWYYEYDGESGLTTIFDSTGHISGQLLIPFSGKNNRISLITNEHGRAVRTLLQVTSENGESAFYLLTGGRLSPPGIRDIAVRYDLIFAKTDKGAGVFSLFTGREVVPCLYESVQYKDGILSALDAGGTETLFDPGGQVLFFYPKGYSGGGKLPGRGLHRIHGPRHTAYLKDGKEIISFPGVKYAGLFYDGIAQVMLDNECWTYIRPNGEHLFDKCYKLAGDFNNGKAIVTTQECRMELIDTTGKTILQTPPRTDSSAYLISWYGNFYKVLDDKGQHLYSPDGRPVLLNVENIPWDSPGDTIHFFQNERFGRLLSDGQIQWAERKDFVQQGIRYVLNGFGCKVEGVFSPSANKWIVPPKPCQIILTPAETAPLVIVSYEYQEDRHAVDVNNGVIYHLESGSMDQIPGVGWLVSNHSTQKSFLYSVDLKTVRPWNYSYSIDWDPKLGLFQVLGEQQEFIGYITKNGRMLF